MSRREVLRLLLYGAGSVALAGCGVGQPQGVAAGEAPHTTPLVLLDGSLQRGGTLVMSMSVGSPRHLNPALLSGGATAVPGTQIFASPLRYDDQWRPEPYLAESWEVSDDGRTVVLHLVQGAIFHDGQPITSEDVAFSIWTVKTYHPFKPMFAPVERVDTPDPLTAIIHLAHPHPAIMLAMSPALLPILPKHIYGDGQDIVTHPANLAPVGSGPFRLARFVPDDLILLRRHEGFFIPGLPYLDAIELHIEESVEQQLVDLERRELHMLTFYSQPSGIERLERAPHLRITSAGNEGVGPINWLAFNLLREPLRDRRVRQAIAHAVDPEFICAHLLQGSAQRATGPIAPSSPFYEPDVERYPLDRAKSEALLDEAGYPRLDDGVRFALTLDYLPIAGAAIHREMALYLKRQLALVGVSVEVRRTESFAAWAERIGQWDFDMTLDLVYNWGDPVIGVHRTYESGNIRQGVVWSNTQNYVNPRVDDLLAQAAVELDTAKRKKLYSEFQKLVVLDLPILFINVMPHKTIYNTRLANPPLTIWGAHSPLDRLFFRESIDRHYNTPDPSSLSPDEPRLKLLCLEAIQVLQANDADTALRILEDTQGAYLDPGPSGTHIIGLTMDGYLFMDNSGQIQRGMDLSDLLDLQGERLLPQLIRAARGVNGGWVQSTGAWPNPFTHRADPMTAYCALLSDLEFVCALEWDQTGEETE